MSPEGQAVLEPDRAEAEADTMPGRWHTAHVPEEAGSPMARFQVTQIFSFPVQMEQSSPAQRELWENPKGLWIFCPPVFAARPG